MTEASVSIMARGRQRSHALREAFCADCGIEVYTRATNGPILCERCRQERRLESNRRYEERQREKAALKAFDPSKKRGYRVVYDPCEAPLAAGLIITREELLSMLELGSAVPGMVLATPLQTYQIVQAGDKLKLEVLNGR